MNKDNLPIVGVTRGIRVATVGVIEPIGPPTKKSKILLFC